MVTTCVLACNDGGNYSFAKLLLQLTELMSVGTVASS